MCLPNLRPAPRLPQPFGFRVPAGGEPFMQRIGRELLAQPRAVEHAAGFVVDEGDARDPSRVAAPQAEVDMPLPKPFAQLRLVRRIQQGFPDAVSCQFV
jgi:hypothetical protein